MKASAPSPLLAPALLALLGGIAGGCRIPDAKVWNLEQLHEPDGSPRRHGVLQSDFEYALRRPIATLLNRRMRRSADETGGEDGQASPVGALFTPKAGRISDPYAKCLENLRELRDCDPDEPRTLALQARLFAWLAVEDTYALSREEAVRGLGEVGRRLGNVALERLPAEGAPPEEVAGRLSDLLAALRPLLPPGSGGWGALLEGGPREAPPATPEEEAAFDQALDALRRQERDFDGELRTFAALTTLLDRLPGELDGLVRLRADLGRRLVGHALRAAAEDESPYVRRAALRAAVRLHGLGVEELERGLADPAPEVLVATLHLIRSRGLPAPPEGDPEAREGWLERLVSLSQRREGPLTVAACRALETLAPEVHGGLRPEAWIDWWSARASRSGGPAADEAPAPPPR